MIPWWSLVAAAAVPFPASGDWQPLVRGGAEVQDVAGDRVGIGDDAGDLLGAPGAAALQWDADADTLFLRMQLTDSADFVPETWAFLLDVDASAADFEYAFMVEGSPHTLTGWSNAAGTPGVHVYPLTSTNPAGYGAAATGETRTVFEGGRFYVDLQLERSMLQGLGVFDATTIRVAGVSAVAWVAGAADVAACDGTLGPCTDLAAVSSEVIHIDLDGDGLTGPEEVRSGTDPADGDFDDDGLADGADPDPLLCDTDGDGLPDGLEVGVTAALADTDPAAGCFLADADENSKTDPGDPDTDGGGRPDGAEDLDRDGAVGAWETDPEDPSDDVDTDGDGIPDALDDRVGPGPDEDSDGDGIADSVEGLVDTDGDGTPDFVDDDSDGDGIPDQVEGDDDPDGDEIPNAQDTDADGDGLPDGVEGGGDEDCDGVPDFLDTDGEDSFCDTAEEPPVGNGNPPGEDPGVPDPFAAPGQFTGGSCSTAPGAAAVPGLLVVLLLLGARTARAQEVNAERFTPSVDGGLLLEVEDAAVAPQGQGGLSLMMDHADDPFVFRPTEGEPVPILDAVTTMRLLGWYSLGPLRVGADLPVHPYTAGFGVDSPLHMGDLRLSTKLHLADPGPFGVALFADASLPTGSGAAWVGAGTLVARVGGIGTLDTGRLLASASLGAHNGTGSELQGLQVSPAVTWGLGAAVRVTDALSAALEADGEAWLGNAGQAGAIPAEGLFSVRQGFPRVGAIVLGAGTGLSRGVGAPTFRLVAGFSWEPGAPEPEPEPAATASAEEPEVRSLIVRAVDPFGTPVPGATVRVLGTLGTPLATGADGLLEAKLRPGAYEVVVAAEGWETASRTFALESTTDLTVVLHPAEVRVDGDRILLTDKVFFQLDRAELAVESLKTLDPLAELLVSRPEIRKVRVEGHTDATGSAAHNLELSQARAEAVVAYLVSQGVPADRLEAKGFGEARLLQEGDSDEVHATNRRVEFHVVTE